MKRASLYTIYLQYTSKHFSRGLPFLKQVERRINRHGTRKRIIIDNALPCEKLVMHNSESVFGGDNTYREFSGWETGINLLQQRVNLLENDVILLANDTFFRNYDPKWISNFKRRHFKDASNKTVMIGWRGSFPQSISFFDYNIKQWIRTNCFLINFGLLNRIRPIHITEESNTLFSGDTSSFFRKSAPLSENYKSYLKSWLFCDESPGIQLAQKWYMSDTLTEKNINFFEHKAISIICEHVLSAKVITHGGELMFINKTSLLKKINKLIKTK